MYAGPESAQQGFKESLIELREESVHCDQSVPRDTAPAESNALVSRVPADVPEPMVDRRAGAACTGSSEDMKVIAVQPDRLTVWFTFLVISQALVLFGAFSFFSRLPNPHSINHIAEDGSDQAQQAVQTASLEDLARQESGDEAGLEIQSDNERQVAYRIRQGDTIATIWTKNGAPLYGAGLAAKAFQEAGIPSTSLRAGEHLDLIVSLAGDITDLTKQLGDGRTLIIQGNSVDGYVPTVLNAEINEQERAVSGTVISSFFTAAAERDIPYSVIDEFVDLFSGRVEFNKQLQPGDTFTINYTERKCERKGFTLAAGPIISASLKVGSDILVAIRHTNKEGRAIYFDENGEPLGNFFLRYPLKFSRISSAFSWARFHPVLQRFRPHYGVDFAAPVGTAVRSVADGVVVEAGFKGDSGNMVKIEHGGRYSTAYLHLAKISVKRGMRVSRGQVIGTVGSTGLSTGPHLHFSLYDRGQYLDPLKAKLPKMPENFEPIPKDLLLATLKDIRQQHAAIAIAMAGVPNRNL